MKILLGILFLPMVVMDLKEKKVLWPYLLILMLLFGGFELLRGSYGIVLIPDLPNAETTEVHVYSRIASLLLGVLFAASGLMFRKSIGPGDSLTVLLFSLVSELWEMVVLLLVSFTLTGIIGLVAFVIFRRKHLEVPFLPFLAAAWIVVILLG